MDGRGGFDCVLYLYLCLLCGYDLLSKELTGRLGGREYTKTGIPRGLRNVGRGWELFKRMTCTIWLVA